MSALLSSMFFQVANPQLPPVGLTPFLIFTLIKMIIVFTIYMVSAALLTLAERKISAWIQDRRGPNRVGKGWLQPAADGIKNFAKEEFKPAGAYEPLFTMAPAIAFIPALMTWAVIPFGSPLPTRWGLMELIFADLPIGFLFILALASLGVYAIVLAGWASNNKYSLLGGLRASAQMISYEIGLGMSLVPVLLLAGNVTFSEIIRQQAHSMWNIANLTVAFIIFVISAFAETNRLPFDMPEAEAELISGYHTEYSSMRFSLFFIAEYCNMITMSAMMAVLFLGGWDIPFTGWDNAAPFTALKTVATVLAFFIKIAFFLFLYMWIRWTLPRFRYDQLMSLGWKILLPSILAYIVVIASTLLILATLGINPGPVHSFILLLLNLCILLLVYVFVDEGRLISPASGRISDERLEQLRSVSANLKERGH